MGFRMRFRNPSLSLITGMTDHQRRWRLVVTARDPAPSASCTTSTSYTWVWNRTENWCSLCREPWNTWNDHRGKRDHICLEMFYNAIVRYDRRWTPASLWWEVEDSLMRRPTAASSTTAASGAAAEYEGCATGAQSFLDYVDAPMADKMNLSALLKYYDRSEHHQRRQELFSCLQHLVEGGIVRVDRASIGGGASFHGALVMFKELFPNVVSMFPHADAKEISALTQMISSTYNSETVFDLCNFRVLLPVDNSNDTAVNNVLLSDEQHGEEALVDNQAGEHSYHLKGIFCRGVLGQLRWALEPDSIAVPLRNSKSNKVEGDDLYWHVLAEHTCRALLAEMVFCRISEYVVRVEGVWRQEGQEMINDSSFTSSRAGFGDEDENLERLVSNWGMMKYMDSYFYDSKFGSRLGNDGMPRRKRALSR